MLQRVLAARAGEVTDERRDLVVHHQRQVGLGVLDLDFRAGLDVGIDGEGVDVVGFVDGRGLGARLVEAVTLLQRCHLQLVNRLDDLVEFALQAVVVADVEVAAEQGVEGLIEVGARGFQMSGLIVGLAGSVFLLRLRDHGVGGIGLRRGSRRLRRGGNRRRNLGLGRLLGDEIDAGEK